jgi:hypothetical protein
MLMPSEVLKETLFVAVVGGVACAIRLGSDTMHSRATGNLVLKHSSLVMGLQNILNPIRVMKREYSVSVSSSIFPPRPVG